MPSESSPLGLQVMAIHKKCGSVLGGIHLEVCGQENVTEVVGGSTGVSEEMLTQNYETYCDPRLNYSQAIEAAFRVANAMPSAERHFLAARECCDAELGQYAGKLSFPSESKYQFGDWKVWLLASGRVSMPRGYASGDDPAEEDQRTVYMSQLQSAMVAIVGSADLLVISASFTSVSEKSEKSETEKSRSTRRSSALKEILDMKEPDGSMRAKLQRKRSSWECHLEIMI
eukprot:s1380_g6.t1